MKPVLLAFKACVELCLDVQESGDSKLTAKADEALKLMQKATEGIGAKDAK